MMGFHTTLADGDDGRGLHAQRSAGGDCSVSSGVLPAGICLRRGAGPWKGTVEPRRFDGLAHTALIPGDLERGCFTPPEWRSEGQRHRSRVAARCRDGLSGARLRVPLHPDAFGRNAVQETTEATHISVTVVNKMYGQKHPRRTVGRTARRTQRNQRPARVHMESDALARVGKSARQRTEVSGTERTRFLPPLKGWVSALWYL